MTTVIDPFKDGRLLSNGGRYLSRLKHLDRGGYGVKSDIDNFTRSPVGCKSIRGAFGTSARD